MKSSKKSILCYVGASLLACSGFLLTWLSGFIDGKQSGRSFGYVEGFAHGYPQGRKDLEHAVCKWGGPDAKEFFENFHDSEKENLELNA